MENENGYFLNMIKELFPNHFPTLGAPLTSTMFLNIQNNRKENDCFPFLPYKTTGKLSSLFQGKPSFSFSIKNTFPCTQIDLKSYTFPCTQIVLKSYNFWKKKELIGDQVSVSSQIPFQIALSKQGWLPNIPHHQK